MRVSIFTGLMVLFLLLGVGPVASAGPLTFQTGGLRVDTEKVNNNSQPAAFAPKQQPPAQRSPGNSDQFSDDRCYQVIYSHILKISPHLGHNMADAITCTVLSYSDRYGVDPLLVTALFTQESGFNMSAISRTGAIGIAQLMPDTASGLGVDPNELTGNIEGGVRYLAQQLYRFRNSGDWTTSYAIAAYNAGPEAVSKYDGIPPYEETRNHVACVDSIFNRLISAYNSI